MIDPGMGFVIGGTHHGATLSSAGRSPGDTRKLAKRGTLTTDSYTAHVYPTENVELETYQLHIFRSSDTHHYLVWLPVSVSDAMGFVIDKARDAAPSK